jgi:hypothetical protein
LDLLGCVGSLPEVYCNPLHVMPARRFSERVVNDGDPIYWDENSGPSSASENTVGTIASEAFTILGGTTTTCFDCGPDPEPGTAVLFGTGVLAAVGVLRRKLF